MSKARLFIIMLGAAFAGSLTIADDAFAQKKMTYQQAFKVCKDELDKAGVYGVGLNAGARTTAGAGCMQKHGFRLKKKSKI